MTKRLNEQLRIFRSASCIAQERTSNNKTTITLVIQDDHHLSVGYYSEPNAQRAQNKFKSWSKSFTSFLDQKKLITNIKAVHCLAEMLINSEVKQYNLCTLCTASCTLCTTSSELSTIGDTKLTTLRIMFPKTVLKTLYSNFRNNTKIPSQTECYTEKQRQEKSQGPKDVGSHNLLL